MYEKLQDSKRKIKEISFDSNTESLKQDFVDIFEGIESDVMHAAQYDEHSGIGTTYLGLPKMKRPDKLKAEHKRPIKEDCYTPGKLLDGTGCNILFNTGASKSCMSKTFYLNCSSLHPPPKLVSKTKNILVDNVQYYFSYLL